MRLDNGEIVRLERAGRPLQPNTLPDELLRKNEEPMDETSLIKKPKKKGKKKLVTRRPEEMSCLEAFIRLYPL